MKQLKTHDIIHIFALLHVAATSLCRLSGIDDSLMLTLLTMAMTVLVCFRLGISVEFTAACMVIVNIVGYLLGIGGASLIGRISGSELLMHALATFMTTEILGWGIVAMSKLFRLGRAKNDWTPRMKWLLMAVAVVFLLRLAYTGLFSSQYFSTESSYRVIRMLLNNSVAILLMLCANIIYVRLMRKKAKSTGQALKYVFFLVFVLSVSVLTALIAGYNLPFNLNQTFTSKEFLLLFTISLIAEILFYCLIYMTDYTISTRRAMFREREKAHMAQYQYLRLKQQVNPHFLFNSLNILDCLVCEKKTSEASDFIHKLAGLYRYMLKNENSSLIPLKDEMEFVMMYADLLNVRFQDGFRIITDIPQSLMESNVVPCAVQMLVENAIKHNTFNKSCPLIIHITASGSSITVSNNINPKISSAEPSTGIGLANIRQQYLDLDGSKITVESEDMTYKVSLPLINKETCLKPHTI